MADEVKVAPAVESKEPAPAKTEAAPTETKAEDVVISDVIKPEERKEPKMVPEAALLEYKKEAKELGKELKEIKKMMEDGKSSKEISGDIKSIADEFGLTESAVEKLIRKVGEQTKAEYDKEIEAKLRPLEEAKRTETVNKTFNEHFDKLMESMPEYKSIANREVIKSLSLDPNNANKTFAKILEESYGHLVTGRKTLEKTQARGGNSDAPIDFNRATKDQEYLREILANPETKAKYNEGLFARIKL
jgi:DNA-binding transcriptional MerR regulator